MIQIGPASSNSSSKPILIAGCSVRAAVWSATYAGYSCIAVDQFGDVDLRSLCPDWRPISLDYRELPDYLFQQKLAGWAYTGGLENHPDLIESCAEQTPLLGIGGETLKQLRDPFRLSQVVNAAGGQMPEMRMFSEGVPEVNWVMKPFHSGGGIRIQRARPDSAGSNDFYYQRRVPGVPYSVSFVVREGEPEILGVARQFISTSSEILVTRSIRRQSPFLFCGGITAATDEVGGRNRLHAFLTQLVSQLPLVGLCGIDVMKSPSGEIMVLEINPRYTATMELLERRAG
ncbi:MAG: ATP-grasp domain-containing protein, partial [Planctomycetaceae bacterium]|nr:ATP-grasp domain-containing protein [Planctomycetaceae bacterium]